MKRGSAWSKSPSIATPLVRASKLIHDGLQGRNGKPRLSIGSAYTAHAVPYEGSYCGIAASFSFGDLQITDKDREVISTFCMNGFSKSAKAILVEQTGGKETDFEISVRFSRQCCTCLISRKPKNKK